MSSLGWPGATIDRSTGESPAPARPHTSVVTDVPEEREELLEDWVAAGLRAGSRMVLVGSGPSAAGAGAPLAGHDRSWAALASGRLVVHDVAVEVFADRRFSPRVLVDLLRAEARRAADDGCRSLRVFGDMVWSWSVGAGPEGLLDFESGLDELVSSEPPTGGAVVTALCQYDRRRFPDRLLDALACCHGEHRDPSSIETATAAFKALPGEAPNEVRLEGELDLSGIDALEDAFGATGAGELVVDLRALAFCDAAGLGAICKPARRGRRTALRGVRPFQRALLDLLGYSSLDTVSVSDAPR